MVCEAHKCIARALRLVADANSIPQEGVCDRHRKRPRETFLPFRRNAGKRNAARHGSVIPHAFVKAMRAAMELVFALVRVEAVFLPVERKRRAADAVCIAPYRRSQTAVPLLIIRKRIITQTNVQPIGQNKALQRCAIVQKRNAVALFRKCQPFYGTSLRFSKCRFDIIQTVFLPSICPLQFGFIVSLIAHRAQACAA